jgi:ABC-type multidrug transport system ATPase subunit
MPHSSDVSQQFKATVAQHDVGLTESDAERSIDTLDESERVHINVRNLSVKVNRSVLGPVKKLLPFLVKKKDQENEGNQSGDSSNDTEIRGSVGAQDIEKNVASQQPVQKDFILQNISLDAPAGRLMAIIGGSGSGKTSLLNMLARRMSANNLDVSGSVLFNGYNSIDHVKHAYVLQQDILQAKLTCRETLMYAAELRLPRVMSREQRRAKVEEVILELGLKECADTRVGDSDHKGLSGGEKRRLSIGIQLIGNPSVIFLDEPTTGLDANSAYLLVKTCHQLAARGRTLIMSLHQPRSDIFFLFDDITILSGGQAIYSGPVNSVVGYFTGLGHSFPNHVNPADHLIDLSVVDSRSDEKERVSKARVDILIQAWKDHQYFGPPMIAQGTPDNSLILASKAPWIREVFALTRRTLVVTYRDPMGFLGLIFESILMGLLVGLIFFKSIDGGSQAGIRTTQGCLYIVISIQSYLLMIFETYRLCRSDMQIFDREYTEGAVTVSGFLISRRFAKFLTEDLFVPLIFTVSCGFF